MTYDEYIQNIIDTRGQWNIPKDSYFERHHIIPDCLGGEGDIINKSGSSRFKKYSHHKNCIGLYPEEHYMAHKLLALENPENKDLFDAWGLMAHVKSNNQDRYYEISAYDYKILKELKSKFNSYLFSTIERTDEGKYNQSVGLKSSVNTKGFKGYTNNIIEIKLKPEKDEIPDGFKPGRLKSTINKVHTKRAYKCSAETKKKLSNVIKGSFKGYTNGKINIQLKIGSEIPEGFRLGRSISGKNKKSNVKKKGVTEGINNILIDINDAIPDGYTNGRTLSETGIASLKSVTTEVRSNAARKGGEKRKQDKKS